MQITLTKALIKKQALLLQEVSVRNDTLNGGLIKITLSSCYEMLSETYGFESWKHLSAALKKELS
jgi:hypothetical protein